MQFPVNCSYETITMKSIGCLLFATLLALLQPLACIRKGKSKWIHHNSLSFQDHFSLTKRLAIGWAIRHCVSGFCIIFARIVSYVAIKHPSSGYTVISNGRIVFSISTPAIRHFNDWKDRKLNRFQQIRLDGLWKRKGDFNSKLIKTSRARNKYRPNAPSKLPLIYRGSIVARFIVRWNRYCFIRIFCYQNGSGFPYLTGGRNYKVSLTFFLQMESDKINSFSLRPLVYVHRSVERFCCWCVLSSTVL